MYHPMREYPDVRILELLDSLPALHALGEHREDLPRELLDLRIVRP
jgi:hypothetical protein